MMDEIRFSPTFRLFTLPTFLEGAASVFDIEGQEPYYNVSRTPNEADILAMRSDWIAVGIDAKNAMNRLSEVIEQD